MPTRPMNKYQLRKAEEERRQLRDDDFMRMMVFSFMTIMLLFFCGAIYVFASGGSFLGAAVLFLLGALCGFYALGMTLAWGGI